MALEKGAVRRADGERRETRRCGGEPDRRREASDRGGDDGGERRRPARRAAGADAPASRGRSSRLGGAILLGAAVVLVGLVLAFVLTRGDDDPEPAAQTEATATATATTRGGRQRHRAQGPCGLQGGRADAALQANDGTVRFAVAAQGVTPNASGQTYSLWFRGEDGSAQLLGDVKDPVAKNGELTSAGPGNDDVDEFPQWFTQYDTILVTLDEEGAKEPGKVILSGDLPNAG